MKKATKNWPTFSRDAARDVAPERQTSFKKGKYLRIYLLYSCKLHGAFFLRLESTVFSQLNVGSPRQKCKEASQIFT